MLAMYLDVARINIVTVGCLVFTCVVLLRRLIEWLKFSSSSGEADDECDATKSRHENLKSEKDLPKPIGLPWLGNMLSLGAHPHKTLAEIAQKYGKKMFRLSAGCRKFVVLSDLEEIKKIAEQFPEQLYGKPRTFTTEKLSLGAHNDMIERWKLGGPTQTPV